MSEMEVQLRAVSKRFSPSAANVLEAIDLSVERGEFVSIIGPSGCGKSTLLKLVAGLSPVSSGELIVHGKVPVKARDLVSFVFQDATLLPWRTVEKNVALALELDGRDKGEIRETTHRLLELVGLLQVGKQYPRQLSGGMKMRVSLARALATKPRLLLMDEPFASLDEMTRDRMNEELLRLRGEQSWTVMFVTHSVEEAVFLSSRVIVLAAHPGRIAYSIDVNLPYPRNEETRDSDEFDALVIHTSRLLREAHKL